MKTFLANLHDKISDRFLKPSNSQMLTSAANQGVDLTKPVPFTFYIAFRHSAEADSIAALLSSRGYKVTRETEKDDPYPYEIEAEISIPGNEQQIERREVLFRSFAKEFSARYDDYSISYSDEESIFY